MRNGHQPIDHVSDPHNALPVARVMVCIGYNPSSQRLIERAGALAQVLQAELFAVHIQSNDSTAPGYRVMLEQNLHVARSLGARTLVEQGAPLVETMARVAQEHAITLIVMGESARSRWAEVQKGSLVRQVLQSTRGIDVYVVADLS